MKLTSERGAFGSIQELRAAYLHAKDGDEYWLDPGPFGQGEWEKDHLHASDVSSCPRAVMYRLRGTPEKPRASMTSACRDIMFWSAYRLHYLTYSAMFWAGLLRTHEHPLSFDYGCTGSFDMLFLDSYQDGDLYLYDMKTELPNAMKYSHEKPKADHQLRVGMYFRGVQNSGHWPELRKGIIEYTDRAGANPPLECEFTNLETWSDLAQGKLDELHRWTMNPELPPILEPVYTGSYWKARGRDFKYLKSIIYAAPWKCGYCDYHLTAKEGKRDVTQSGSTCCPYNEAPIEVATFNTSGGVETMNGKHGEGVAAFLESHVKTIPIEDEE